MCCMAPGQLLPHVQAGRGIWDHVLGWLHHRTPTGSIPDGHVLKVAACALILQALPSMETMLLATCASDSSRRCKRKVPLRGVQAQASCSSGVRRSWLPPRV